MSATNRGSVRLVGDTYYTPDNVAQACVNTLGALIGKHALEPHVGGGAFARALRQAGARSITGYDSDGGAPGLAECGFAQNIDFLKTTPRHYDCIAGNPPYATAEAHVRHALAYQPEKCGFLLRLGFLEGLKRKAFWDEHPPTTVHVLRRRPSFTGGGTDASAYGFFVWNKERPNDGPSLSWLDT
jgi:hypothetical protein